MQAGTTTAITSGLSFAGNVVILDPISPLTADTTYTVMLTAAITDLANNALAAKEWRFTTAASGPGPGTSLAPVPLGTAGNFAILAGTTITSAAATAAITGDVGLNASYVNMSSLLPLTFNIPPSSLPVSTTSDQVVGDVYAKDFGGTTSTDLAKAVTDMDAAYTNAAGRANPTPLSGVINVNQTLSPGLYKSTVPVVISSDVTLDGGGDLDAVWIFQASSITLNANTSILLTGGAQASNIFWQSANAVTVSANATMEGIILSGSVITLGTNATINGSLLTPGNVILGSNSTVTQQ